MTPARRTKVTRCQCILRHLRSELVLVGEHQGRCDTSDMLAHAWSRRNGCASPRQWFLSVSTAGRIPSGSGPRLAPSHRSRHEVRVGQPTGRPGRAEEGGPIGRHHRPAQPACLERCGISACLPTHASIDPPAPRLHCLAHRGTLPKLPQPLTGSATVPAKRVGLEREDGPPATPRLFCQRLGGATGGAAGKLRTNRAMTKVRKARSPSRRTSPCNAGQVGSPSSRCKATQEPVSGGKGGDALHYSLDSPPTSCYPATTKTKGNRTRGVVAVRGAHVSPHRDPERGAGSRDSGGKRRGRQARRTREAGEHLAVEMKPAGGTRAPCSQGAPRLRPEDPPLLAACLHASVLGRPLAVMRHSRVFLTPSAPPLVGLRASASAHVICRSLA